MRARSTWLFLSVAGLGLFSFEGSSRAASPPELAARLDWGTDHAPEISVDAGALADAPLRARIESGAPVTLVLRVTARARDDGAIVRHDRSCRIAYDVWQRRYDVTRAHHTIAATAEDALAACLVLDHERVGDRRWASATFSIDVAVDPISPRTARGLSRWLGRAGGGVGPRTLFGSLVGPLVFEPGTAERTLGARRLHVVSEGTSQ